MSANDFSSELLKMEREVSTPKFLKGIIYVTLVYILDQSTRNKYVSVRGISYENWERYRLEFYNLSGKRFVTHKFRHCEVLMTHPSSVLPEIDCVISFLESEGYEVIKREKQYDKFISVKTRNKEPSQL